MKQIAIVAAVLLLLTGGWFLIQDRAPETLESQPLLVSEPVTEPAPKATDDSDEAGPQIVEESAAEEEDVVLGNKPIILAQAGAGAASRDWEFSAGTHFTRLVPTQPTVGGADKIEVAEVFWYGCGHCFDFEPYINGWADKVPANVRFVRIPAMWNKLVTLHAQLFFAEEVLVKNGKIEDPAGFRSAVFLEFHRRGNHLTSEEAIQALFERFGVSEEDFKNTWGSFEVSQKMRVADDLARRWGISGVPAVVVNGKYSTGAVQAGSYPKLLNIIDELVARESVR